MCCIAWTHARCINTVACSVMLWNKKSFTEFLIKLQRRSLFYLRIFLTREKSYKKQNNQFNQLVQEACGIWEKKVEWCASCTKIAHFEVRSWPGLIICNALFSSLFALRHDPGVRDVIRCLYWNYIRTNCYITIKESKFLEHVWNARKYNDTLLIAHCSAFVSEELACLRSSVVKI